jgi:anti-sigma factor RsiW
MSITEETLMAYADGELDDIGRSAVEQAMLHDPALATKVAQHQALRCAVFDAFHPVVEEAIPARLQASVQVSKQINEQVNEQVTGQVNDEVQRDNIVNLAQGRKDRDTRQETAKRQAWSLSQWGSLAAMLVLGVMLGRLDLFGAGERGGAISSVALATDGGMTAQGKLAMALSTQLASAPVADANIKIGLSFVAKDGAYCRSFALDGSAGLACREAEQWKIALMVDKHSDSPEGQYRQAGSEIPPAVLEAIEQRMAGAALDAQGELTAKERAWKK